ncbi:hypothetical protein AC579_4626 [Pseudocercospora musae]|uniref:Uncharacterized protein n=1 Tax=Pseudocercospora musae TaxID=113226 RepID=A0A139HJW6_9PEZI|nr:hypothetical protein AC579_4626 [Pseudocercospora musae]
MVLSRRQSYKDLMVQANEAENTEKAAAENKRRFLQAAEEAKAQEEEDERLCAELRGRIADLRKEKEAKKVSIANSLATCSIAIESHDLEAQAETEPLQARIRELQKECTLIEVNRRSKVEEAKSICDADIKKYRGDISSLDTDITKAQVELQEYETLQVESADEEPAHGPPRTHDPGANIDDNSHKIAVTEIGTKSSTQETVSFAKQKIDAAVEESDDDVDDDPVRPWRRRLGSQGNCEKGNSAKHQKQIARQNWLATTKDRAVEATPTMLQGEEIEQHSFSDDLQMVVFLNDYWHEMKCYVCLSNRTVDDSGKFFSGLRGLIGHVTQCHGLTNRADVISRCIVRTFTAGEIRALRSGIQPHPPIELSFGDTARRNERVVPKCTPSQVSDEEHLDAGHNTSNGDSETCHAEASTASRESCQQTVETPETEPNLVGAQSRNKAASGADSPRDFVSDPRLGTGGEPFSELHKPSRYKYGDLQIASQSASNSDMPHAKSSSTSSTSSPPPALPEILQSQAEDSRGGKPDHVAPGALSDRSEQSAVKLKVPETQLSSHGNTSQSQQGGSSQASSITPTAYPEATRSLSCSRPLGPENGATTSNVKYAHIEAPPTTLSRPNLHILHRLHPNTVHINGGWCLIRCKICQANASSTSRGRRIFLWGIAGLQKHVREAHELDAGYGDMEEWCESSEIPNSALYRRCAEEYLDIVNEPFPGHHVKAPPSSTLRATAQRQESPEDSIRDPRLRGRESTTGLRLGTKVPAVPSTLSASARVHYSPFAIPKDGDQDSRGVSRPTSHPPRGTSHTPVGTQRHTTPFVPRGRARSSSPRGERTSTMSDARKISRSPPYKKQKHRGEDVEGGSFFKRFCWPAVRDSEKRDSPRC